MRSDRQRIRSSRPAFFDVDVKAKNLVILCIAIAKFNMDVRRQKNEDMLAKLQNLGMGGSAGGGANGASGMADAGMSGGKVGGLLSFGAERNITADDCVSPREQVPSQGLPLAAGVVGTATTTPGPPAMMPLAGCAVVTMVATAAGVMIPVMVGTVPVGRPAATLARV